MAHDDPKKPAGKTPPEDPVGEMDPDEARGSGGLNPQEQKNKVDNPKDNPAAH